MERSSLRQLKGNAVHLPVAKAAMPLSDDNNIFKQPQPGCTHT
ncbi:MAG: hypothetical protein U0V75_03885 [Ferruginibacter sp.]